MVENDEHCYETYNTRVNFICNVPPPPFLIHTPEYYIVYARTDDNDKIIQMSYVTCVYITFCKNKDGIF